MMQANVFETHAHTWWDEKGPFKPLHQINPLRLEFILKNIKHFFQCDTLQGLRILDVGCGGGLLCEPLARLGADVTGIDLSQEAIDVARDHAVQHNLSIQYKVASLESIEDASFDVVIASEVIEHVTNPKDFVHHISRVLKPKGCTIITTLNRTFKSYLLGIVVAENILKWAPKGAHEHHMFIKPSELNTYLEEAKLNMSLIQGLVFNPFKCAWEMSRTDMDVNYFAFAWKSKSSL